MEPRELRDGGSDQWLWVIPIQDISFVFVEIIDLPAHCGRDATVNWVASVDYVEPLSVPGEEINKALSSCGIDFDDITTESETPQVNMLALAEVLYDYGCKAPLWCGEAGTPVIDEYNMVEEPDEDGEDFKGLKREAFNEATTFASDNQLLDDTLDSRVVNAIGQTAREYSQGTSGLWAALDRIAAKGEAATKEQQTVLQMYGACKNTLGAGPIPERFRRGETE